LGVGRFTYRKGFDLLVSAFIRIADSFPDLNLVLLGEGEMRQSLEDLMAETGLRDRVSMEGWVSPAEVSHLMRASLFVVVPSRQEGFGMTALEAMAAGKAVVATKVGALPEILADQSNPLVAATVEDLAKGMVDLLEDFQKREAVGRRNQERAADYSWQKIINRYLNVYQSLMMD
jgi:glycosyltransferase involved in cell wall biosynthesis